MSTAVAPFISASSPFPGLRPFRASDAPFFFGRDEQIETLLNRLATRRLLAVVGTSGSGKSSLVGAGLIPTIERGHLGPATSTWLIANIFRPGTDPLAALAHALAETFAAKSIDATQLETELLRTSAALSDFAKTHLAPNQRLLVFVDQFEELFRYREQSGVTGRDRSTAFVKLLLTATGNAETAVPAAHDIPPVYVILTMRSGYLGKCAQFRGLSEALNDSQYLVPRLSRDQLRETIEGPIALAGANISAELTDRLLNDTGDNPDMLPLLQHALARLWEESKGTDITLAHYKAVGEIGNALNLDADNALTEVKKDPRKEGIVRRVFQRLVEPAAKDEETRRPTRLGELALVCAEDSQTVRDSLKQFSERGFITHSEDRDPLVDISHESLIRQWKELGVWVADEEKSANVYRRLSDAAANNRPLYRGADLAGALRWQKEGKPNVNWAARYTNQSYEGAIGFLRRSWRKRKILQATGVLAVFAIAAVAILFFFLYRAEEEQKTHAELQTALAKQQTAKADGQTAYAEGQRADAQKQAAIAEDQKTIADQQRALAEMQTQTATREKLSADSLRLVAQAQLQQSNQPDLAFLLGIEAHNAAKNYESRNGLLTGIQNSQAVVAMFRHKSAATTMAFSPDGKLLASASADKTVRLWDTGAHRPMGQPLSGHIDIVWGVAFSPDGKLLASASLDTTVRLWDVAKRQPVGQPLYGHASTVYSVAFSPDGKFLASASDDFTVRLWDVAIRQPVGQPLYGHTSSVYSVVFSPDGKLLASAGDDDTSAALGHGVSLP